jgi:predicted ester cyclase
MDAIEVVKAALAASEAHQNDKFADMLTDDMVFAGPVPEPVGKREFVALMAAIGPAVPDWKFNARDFKQDGDKVTAVYQISGTQTGVLDLPMPGLQKIPASGKHFTLPRELNTLTLRNGKISRWESEVVPGGGVMGMLAQLGIPLPPM